MQKIIIYDIDYTLIPFDSFFKFVAMLIKKHPVEAVRLPGLIWGILRTGKDGARLTRYKGKWLKLTERYSDEELDRVSREFVNKSVIPYIKKGVMEEMQKYKNDGYRIILATASFEFYLKYLAAYLNTDLFFGTLTEKKGKRRYIQGCNCKGEEKIIRIRQEIEITDIDRTASIGFSDSMSDYPYTKLVGKFHIVDKKKWEIKKTFSVS